MQRIVCAAILFTFCYDYDTNDTEELVVTGVRHYDNLMRLQIGAIDEYRWSHKTSDIQGFVDNRGVFLNRKAALIVATKAGQIIQKSGNPNSIELFSEDLY